MKLKNTILLGITGFALLAGNNAFAQTPPVLQFTENSSTELTVTLDGAPFGTVQNLAPNQWEWHSGTSGELVADFIGLLPIQWTEPENDSLVNVVNFGFFVPTFAPDTVKPAQTSELGAQIFSDVAFGPGLGPFGDGQPVGPLSLPGLFATVVFVDLGDQGTGVPDSSSSWALLLGASLILIGVRTLAPAARG